MLLSTTRAGALASAVFALTWASVSKAEVEVAKAAGWTVGVDGRVNAFVSHIRGDDRPEELRNAGLNWVGFNESGSRQSDPDGKLRSTRIRGGFVPTTLGFNFRKDVNEDFKLWSRVELGIQITNITRSEIADPTWMEPRQAFLDLTTPYGSVRAGRDMGLFSRGNLFMNYELGHAYGVGFPCAYQLVYGGACGHVGFGVIWPDYHAQISYSTPNFGDIFQVTVGAFDPRNIATIYWNQTPLPRFEGEAVANYSWQEGWGVKAWGNGFWQTLGTTVEVMDETTGVTTLQEFTLDAYGAGGGVQANLGPVKAGVAGYTGQGMDAFVLFNFNPISYGQSSELNAYERRFRPSNGFLAQASVTLGDTWVMGGFGRVNFDRVATDNPIDTLGAAPLIRTNTGISAGVFHRIDSVVLGVDYFNARYGFDPHLADPDDDGPLPPRYEQVAQVVHFVNAGATLEW
jgi:hypothetical protein